jgi:beta-glucanase (GH16 family)
MKKTIILIITELLIISVFAQLPVNDRGTGITPGIQTQVPVEHPSVDKNWKVVFNDDFNTFNTLRWYKTNNGVHGVKPHEEPQVYVNSNAYLDNGKLVLRSEKLNTPYQWTNSSQQCPHGSTCQYGGNHYYISGQVESQEKYGYGYYEIYSTMPVSSGYWAAFWLWAGRNDISNNDCWYNEIDIFETNGCKKSVESNAHWGFNCPLSLESSLGSIPHAANNYDNVYHWYGLGWNSDKITWYIDRQPVRQITNNMGGIGIQNPMRIIMNVALFPNGRGCNVSNNTIFPNYMKVDQANVYSLICDDNDVNEILDFENFNYAVKKSITLSGTSSIPQGKRIALRATDFIELNADFEIPVGSELFLDVHPCNETVIE